MGVFNEIDWRIKIKGQIKTGDVGEDYRIERQLKAELELLCAKYGLDLEYLGGGQYERI